MTPQERQEEVQKVLGTMTIIIEAAERWPGGLLAAIDLPKLSPGPQLSFDFGPEPSAPALPVSD